MANLHLSAIIVIVVLVAGLFAKEMTGIHLRIAAVPVSLLSFNFFRLICYS